MGIVADRVKEALRKIPRGRVSSYGGIAARAGLHNGARTVARLLHSSAVPEGLPWWRVVRTDGTIALRPGARYEEQIAFLESEGVPATEGRVDIEIFGWPGRGSDSGLGQTD